jgi:flagellar biosynthesis protein
MNTDNEKTPSRAIALYYDGETAPKVSAKGEGFVAERIVEIARAHGIPLYDDPQLAGLLARVELGDEIPEALYVAVARVIAFAYMVAGKFPKEYDRGGL